MNDLVDIHSPRATLISLVLDHVNTPTPAALHETFAPAEAHRLLRTLDSHYTPKHGSWLKMAEVELAAVSTQGLNRRLPDPAALQ